MERHGPGPYPAEELATIAGLDDAEGVRRVLARMVTDGLATPPDEPPDVLKDNDQ